MAVYVSLMLTLIQVIVFVLLLLMLAFAVPKLHPLLYMFIFCYFLLHLLSTVVFPFGLEMIKVFDAIPEPFPKLMIGSAILFYTSELLAKQLEDSGYGSLAAMSHLAIKITILTLWLPQLLLIIDMLTVLIKK